MLMRSASLPRNADPIPPIPNAKPKNKPETMPILPGISSCAYTRIAEKADARINPMITLRTLVQNKFT